MENFHFLSQYQTILHVQIFSIFYNFIRFPYIIKRIVTLRRNRESLNFSLPISFKSNTDELIWKLFTESSKSEAATLENGNNIHTLGNWIFDWISQFHTQRVSDFVYELRYRWYCKIFALSFVIGWSFVNMYSFLIQTICLLYVVTHMIWHLACNYAIKCRFISFVRWPSY